MSPLPDTLRERPSRPTRALAASLVRAARAVTWRALHPAARSRFLEAPAPPSLARLYYEAPDGWRAPVYCLPAAPGGSGEPVILAHALGAGADSFRYGSGPSLASALSRAGFAVYLLSHRGDADALAPEGPRDFDFDAIVARDLPAALERVREHAGFPRAHWIGHGLGGQLAYAHVARTGGAGLASLVALCAAVRFARARSPLRRWARVAGLLPQGWRVPGRALGPWIAPWVDDQGGLPGVSEGGATPGARLRGALHHSAEDVPVALVAQIHRWLQEGSLVDATGGWDYAEALRRAQAPLLVGVAEADAVCPPEAGLAALERWGVPDRQALHLPASYGHLDPLLAADAPEASFAPVVAWLDARRRFAWPRDGEIPTLRRYA